MQEMTHQHTRELDIYYNEHRKACTNCGKQFQNGMTAHLGYLVDRTPAVLCDDCSQLLSETVVRYYWMKPKYEEVLPTAKLWRYMDLSKFISLIGKKKLYFASLESFEDIFEGAKGIVNRKGIWDGFYSDFFKKAIQKVPGMNREDLTDEFFEKSEHNLYFDMKHFREVFKEIESLRKHSKCKIRFAPKFEYTKNIVNSVENFYKNEKEFGKLYKPCKFPFSDTFITPEGFVYPCLSVKMGDLKEQTLKEIYNSEKYKNFRKIIKTNGYLPACDMCCELCASE